MEIKENKDGGHNFLGDRTITSILNSLRFHQFLSSKDQKHIEDLFDFRNKIMHRSMFKYSELNDEKQRM